MVNFVKNRTLAPAEQGFAAAKATELVQLIVIYAPLQPGFLRKI